MFQVDTLYSLTHSASEMTERSSAHLTHFLGELASRLRTRSSSTRPSSSTSTSLTTFVPRSTRSSTAATRKDRDPRDLLRALSHTDTAAPATTRRGDATRRLAQEVRVGTVERKVTATPRRPPAGTPGRKPPGTPRTSRKG